MDRHIFRRSHTVIETLMTPPGELQVTDLSGAPGAWRLTTAAPNEDFARAGSVLQYWEVEGALSAFRETLLPNGAVELMVNLGPPHTVHGPAGAKVWDHSWLYGLHERAVEIESAHGTHLVSARLHPLGAAGLLGPSIPTVANTIVTLESLIGSEAASLRDALLSAGSPGPRFEILERFLRRQRDAPPAPDFVRQAATEIEAAHGHLHVSRLHEELGVSRKHLAVAFRRWMGVPAKAYARIRRFVWTHDRLCQTIEPDWPRLAQEAGYSDQSHLVRDFRRIGAASPTEYLRRWTPGGGSLLEAG
jgi:AraC-like DNA-binding protein